MSGRVEAQRVAAFVTACLQADTEPDGVAALLNGRIYRDRVPAGALLPAATVTLVSSTDSLTLGGVRVFQAVLVDVRVVGNGTSYGPVNPAADRADFLLDQLSGTRDGVRTVKLRRESTQAFVEDDAGKAYCHVVQTYRSESHQTPT